MQYENIIKELKNLENPDALIGMAKYGINTKNNLGISIYQLRNIAKKIGKNHEIALKLWESQIHDARLLACFVDDSKKITDKQMDNWANDFDSWDICDQACMSLFDRSPLAWLKVEEWSKSEKEFVRRGAFSLLAGLAVHEKTACNIKFMKFSSIIKIYSVDERNYVKKAVNWALRNIGKRNLFLNKKMLKLAEEISTINSKSARWIARDAIRELKSEKIQKRLKNKINK
jgi:3-methyladenine DNA glycosylase AlkD